MCCSSYIVTSNDIYRYKYEELTLCQQKYYLTCCHNYIVQINVIYHFDTYKHITKLTFRNLKSAIRNIQITQYLYSDPFKHKNQLVNASIIEQEICKQIL